jgi:putative membrane protein
MSFTMRGVAGAALLGLLAAFAGAEDSEQKGKESIDDATFVKMAASGNMAEIKAGEMAQKENVGKAVSDFAARMVKDHSKAQNELTDAAKSAKAELPREMTPMHKKMGEMLAEHKGKKDFEAAYTKMMVESHTKSAELYEKASSSVKDENLRKYAEKTLPVVREHLKEAKKLAENSGKDR